MLAYFPKKGVQTALEEIFDRIEEPNIREFDLRGFFDNVKHKALQEAMEKKGWPEEVAEALVKIQQSIPKLEEVDFTNEDVNRKVLLQPDKTVNPNLEEELKNRVNKILKYTINNPELRKGRLEAIMPEGFKIYKDRGVAQGAATLWSFNHTRREIIPPSKKTSNVCRWRNLFPGDPLKW